NSWRPPFSAIFVAPYVRAIDASYGRCRSARKPARLEPPPIVSSRRKCQQSRLDLGLCLSRGFTRRTIIVADAHRDDGKRFVVSADERLTAFLELESQLLKSAERPLPPTDRKIVPQCPSRRRPGRRSPN